MSERHPFTFGPASGRRKSAVIAVSIGDQDFVPVEQTNRLRELLDEALDGWAECHRLHPRNWTTTLADVERIRRAAREVR